MKMQKNGVLITIIILISINSFCQQEISLSDKFQNKKIKAVNRSISLYGDQLDAVEMNAENSSGIGIITLFFSLFGLRKRSYSKVKGSSIETELINDVDIVKDSPLGTDIPLNIQVDLLGSYNGEINSLISSTDFLKQFNPSMMVFASSDNDYTEFRPNVVIQLENNPLINLNMTLSDYMDSAYSLTQEMQNIVGKRQVRIGSNMATQWFRINLSNLLGNEVKTDITYTQFQKIVITDDLMGIITISYGDETKPNDIKILQDFLNKFGIK